jgi:integrase
MRIYNETVRELVQTLGFFQGMWIATRCMVDSAKILYYQWRIRRGERAGIHGYFTAHKLRRTLEKVGFTDIHVETVYAGQCLMAHAAKSIVRVGTLRDAAQSSVSA